MSTNGHTTTAPPILLTIAGFDPSCGAGTVADLKTFAAHGCYGVAAITSLTVQNTQGVEAVHNTPSAELRADQRDDDTLPPYDVLDPILERLVEREQPVSAIVAAGFDRETVLGVERMLHLAEYKRRQAAPGVKVTLKNFGRDRRYPITNAFRDPGAPLAAPCGSQREPQIATKSAARDR